MRKRNALTSSFLGLGGRGNSPPQWDGNFLLFYYLKNIFSIDFLFMGFCRVVGWGMRFRTPPKCADAVYCVRALGGGRKRRGGKAHGVFVGRSGGGCVFEHPPNVRTRFIAFALWGVGGNALVGWYTGYS